LGVARDMPVDPGQPLSTRSLPAGDAINVAIFLPNELEGGLARLTAGGYITEHEGAFAPTDKALAYIAKVSQVCYSPE
jgi:hypothetical protein